MSTSCNIFIFLTLLHTNGGQGQQQLIYRNTMKGVALHTVIFLIDSTVWVYTGDGSFCAHVGIHKEL